MPLIPITDIRPDPDNARRARPSGEEDVALATSIAAQGVLQPILVRRAPGNEGGYIVVDGERRWRVAVGLGHAEIRAEVLELDTPAAATAAQAAANVVRAPMTPLDQWRVVVRLQEAGWPLDAAARALGLPERQARRLDRLGRLHPDVLAAIEAHGLPDPGNLGVIAMAPPEVQARAIARKDAWSGSGADRRPTWWRIAERCRTDRIPRARAIFDVELAGVAFEEDLFAEPGSEEQFTTTDVAGFMEAQRAALAARAERAKRPLHVVEWDARAHAPALPKGWRREYDWDGKGAVPKGAERFASIIPSGYLIGKVVEIAASPPQRAATTTTAEEEGTPGDDGAAAPARAESGAGGRGPITQRGRELVAAAKTTALRCALRDREPPPAEECLALLLLALCAANVTVEGEQPDLYSNTRFDDLVTGLFGPDGRPVPAVNDVALRRLACEAVARILVVGPLPHRGKVSGDAAEWIGARIGAEASLPPMDTPEVLATLRDDALREAAFLAGIEHTGLSTRALRQKLAHACPALRPPGAAFAAPPPRPEPEEDEDEDEEGLAAGEGPADAVSSAAPEGGPADGAESPSRPPRRRGRRREAGESLGGPLTDEPAPLDVRRALRDAAPEAA